MFVLPGILGSHLRVDGKRVWISPRFLNNLDVLKWDPDSAARVEPDGTGRPVLRRPGRVPG